MRNQNFILRELKREIKTGKYAHITFEEKFWKQVNLKTEDECWEFNKKLFSNGYGCFKINHLDVLAHHVSYLLIKGFIQDGNVIMHNCDNRKCVNPKHLSEGSQNDNITDMFNKNRQNPPMEMKNHRCKLTDKQILEIRELKKLNMLNREIALLYGVSLPQVSRINNYKRRANV
jgi:hypothetical protein